MKYDFSKVEEFAQATEDNRYYRNFEPMDTNQEYTLYELAMIIRTNGNGKSVREAIAQGLEKMAEI